MDDATDREQKSVNILTSGYHSYSNAIRSPLLPGNHSDSNITQVYRAYRKHSDDTVTHLYVLCGNHGDSIAVLTAVTMVTSVLESHQDVAVIEQFMFYFSKTETWIR